MIKTIATLLSLFGDLTNKNSAIAVQCAVVNHKGYVRKNNEDNFYMNGVFMEKDEMNDGAIIFGTVTGQTKLFAVCDGMGGSDAGEEASYRAVKEISEKKNEQSLFNDKARLTKFLRDISDAIYKEALQREYKTGTTITLVVLNGKEVLFVNVGDSRTYRLRGDQFIQISQDHSKVQRMIAMGIMTPEQARKDPNRHVITQFLGMSTASRVVPYYASEEILRNGDVLLLCSDGLTDMVEDEVIAKKLKSYRDPKEAAQELVKNALENGGKDNITVMILRIS